MNLAGCAGHSDDEPSPCSRGCGVGTVRSAKTARAASTAAASAVAAAAAAAMGGGGGGGTSVVSSSPKATTRRPSRRLHEPARGHAAVVQSCEDARNRTRDGRLKKNAHPSTATHVGRRRASEWAAWRRFRPQWTAIAAAAANATARAATAATSARASVAANVHREWWECMNEGFEPDVRLGGAASAAVAAVINSLTAPVRPSWGGDLCWSRMSVGAVALRLSLLCWLLLSPPQPPSFRYGADVGRADGGPAYAGSAGHPDGTVHGDVGSGGRGCANGHAGGGRARAAHDGDERRQLPPPSMRAGPTVGEEVPKNLPGPHRVP